MEAKRQPEGTQRRRSRRRVILVLVALFFLVVILREVLFPYRGQPYEEIPHGDHTHYVPKDRDPNVPIGQFPTRRPGANERITPQGEIVPIQNSESE